MAQSVKLPTLGFSSGHNLTVCEFKPPSGLQADSAEPAWDFLSVALSAPPHSFSLSQKINKLKKKEKKLNNTLHELNVCVSPKFTNVKIFISKGDGIMWYAFGRCLGQESRALINENSALFKKKKKGSRESPPSCTELIEDTVTRCWL